MSETPFDPRNESITRLSSVRDFFQKDLNALTADQLGTTQGGCSRCAYDLAYEITGFLGVLSTLLETGKSEFNPPQGWVRAPQDFHNKEKAVEAVSNAFDHLIEALKGYKGDFLEDKFPFIFGDMNPLTIANFAVSHVMYHSGQLNYIQTIHGDDEFHWMKG